MSTRNIIKRFQPVKLLIFVAIIINLTINSPINSMINDTTVVERHGQLQVAGNKIINKNGVPVALHGMSLFWSQWGEGSKYYNYDCIKWLRDDWKCTVVRASMGIEHGGYLTNKDRELSKVLSVIDACIDLGIYVIVDWHDHNAHDHESEAIEFFKDIASVYGDEPNIIYEIYNEPEQVSWLDVIKPYAEDVITEIRSIDPDNIIIVGTPTWSQDVDNVANNPLNFSNIAYALHFYAASHKGFLRSKAKTALNKGIALFVSEFGTTLNTGTGTVDFAESETWFNFMEENKLSWCNWSIADKAGETSAALITGASATGNWSSSNLTPSGTFVRDKIISYSEGITSVEDQLNNLELPKGFFLNQNYPNPFNPITKIKYTVGDALNAPPTNVVIKVYDILGNEIATLVNEIKPPGNYEIEFNADDIPSGVYYYSLSTGSFKETKKMILLK